MGYIEKKIQDTYKSPPSSIVKLHARVVEQWNQMPPDFCSRLFESVPRRIRTIIEWLMDEISSFLKL